MGVWDIGMSEWPTAPEKARNNVHEILHFMNPREFPRGPVPIRLDPLFRAIANDKIEPGAAATFGQVQEIGVPERLSSVHPEGVRINAWYTDHLDKYVKACPQCRLNGVACRMRRVTTLTDVPPMIISALHFTCIVVDAGGGLWFHDGMTTRRSTSYMGNLRTIGDRRWLHRLDDDKKLAAAIYTL
ncbi:hypothetical protein B0H14DRAFT_2641457 [Mycena olivaceomarginata]|nr:hypothetical protein B0H14DRAFT_2641457 [Mycena olivaceomarginata]